MSENNNVDLVEAVIDRMVESEMGVTDAVATVLDGEMLPESVEVDLEEGVDECPACGSDAIEFGYVEDEDEEIPAMHCKACDTGFVAEDDEGDDEPEVLEAEIDEDNPQCPVCESDDLEAEMVEDEGEEIPVIVCNGCGAGMVVAEDEED
jgi:transcription elongation factor Elf1